MDIDVTEKIVGPCGTAEWIPPVPTDHPRCTDFLRATLSVSRGNWLITSPGWHPLWSQYVLNAIALVEHPDLPSATFHFEGATHEMLLVAINPDVRLTLNNIHSHYFDGLPYLRPINICHQFECTDDEIAKLSWLAARAVVNGWLNPETADAPTRIREDWLTACVKGLAHLRGEEHAP